MALNIAAPPPHRRSRRSNEVHWCEKSMTWPPACAAFAAAGAQILWRRRWSGEHTSVWQPAHRIARILLLAGQRGESVRVLWRVGTAKILRKFRGKGEAIEHSRPRQDETERHDRAGEISVRVRACHRTLCPGARSQIARTSGLGRGVLLIVDEDLGALAASICRRG